MRTMAAFIVTVYSRCIRGMSGPRRRGRRGRCFCAVAVLFRLSLLCSLCCDLGDRGSGAGFVDDRLVAGVGGDEGAELDPSPQGWLSDEQRGVMQVIVSRGSAKES